MCKIKSDFTCYDDTEKHYKMMLVIWKFGSIITWTSPVAKTLGDYNLLWSWCSQPGVFSRESKFSNCDSLLGGPGVPRQYPGIHRQYPGSTTEFREAPGPCLGAQRRKIRLFKTIDLCAMYMDWWASALLGGIYSPTQNQRSGRTDLTTG